MSRMDLRGPCEYKRKGAFFRNLKNPDIVDASIEISGVVIPLQENWFSVERGIDTLFIWHFYRYYNDMGAMIESRWYDTRIPVNTFKRIKKTLFRYELPGPTIIRVFFTEKIAGLLRDFN
jgi:hypothetical protein